MRVILCQPLTSTHAYVEVFILHYGYAHLYKTCMHAHTEFFFQKPLLLPVLVTEAMRIRETRIKRLAGPMNWISYIMTEKLPV